MYFGIGIQDLVSTFSIVKIECTSKKTVIGFIITILFWRVKDYFGDLKL